MQICESITVYLTKYSDKKISQQPAGNFIFETAYTYTHSVHLLCNLHEFMIWLILINQAAFVALTKINSSQITYLP